MIAVDRLSETAKPSASPRPNRASSRNRRLCLLSLAACGVFVVGCVDQGPPQKVLDGQPWEIVVTGRDLAWELTDPGFDGELGTDDDFEISPPLHVPAHTPIRVVLQSRDFIYTFELPEHELREIAIPDLSYQLEFDSGEPREEKFRGDQFCGYAHPALSGTIIVQSWKEYRRWQTQSHAGYEPDTN